MEKKFSLSHEAITHIAQLLQVAMLSGTDIYDHLRLMTLTQGENDTLSISQESSDRLTKEINCLIVLAEEAMKNENQSE